MNEDEPLVESLPEATHSPKPRWRVWLLRIAKWTSWFFALLVASFGALLIALHTDYGRDVMRSRLERKLSEVFVGDVRIGKLEGSLLSDLSLVDVSISDASGAAVVEFKRFRVAFSLIELIHKTVEIDAAELTGLLVHAEQDDDGALNLASLLKSESDDDDDEDKPETHSEPSSWSVRVGNIRIRTSEAHLRDGETFSAVKELSLDASASFNAGVAKLTLKSVSATVLPPTTTAEAQEGLALIAEARISAGPDGIEATGVDIQLGGAGASIPTIIIASDGATLAQATVAIPASLVQAFDPASALLADVGFTVTAKRGSAAEPIALALNGTLGVATFTATGSVSPESGDASLHLKVGTLNASKLWRDAAPSSVDLTFEATAKGETLESMAASASLTLTGEVDKVNLGDLRLRATVDKGLVTTSLRPGEGPMWVDAKATYRIDTNELVDSSLHLSHPRIQSLLAGYSDARGDILVDAKAHGHLEKITTQGTITSKHIYAEGNRLKILSASWEATLSPGLYKGSASVAVRSIRSGGTAYGSATLDVATTDQANHFAVTLRNRGPRRSHQVNLKSTVTHSPAGTLVDIHRVRLALKGLAWRGSGGQIELRENSAISLRNINLDSPAGHIHLDGDIKVDQGLSEGDIELIARNVDLASISEAMSLQPALRGSTTLRASLNKKRGSAAKATVHLGLKNISQGKDLPSTSGTATLRLRNRNVAMVADLKTRGVGTVSMKATARGPRDALNIERWIRLGERSLRSASIETSPLKVAALSHLAPEMPSSGTIALSGTLGEAGAVGEFNIAIADLVHAKTVEPANANVRVLLAGNDVTLEGDVGISERLESTITGAFRLPGPLLKPRTLAQLRQDSVQAGRLRVSKLDLPWWDETLQLGYQPENASADFDFLVAEGARSATLTVHAVQAAQDPWGKPQARASELIATLRPDSIDLTILATLAGKDALRSSMHLGSGWDVLASGNQAAISSTTISGELDVLGMPLALLHALSQPGTVHTAELAKGTLLANAKVRGTIASPIVSVRAHTKGGAVAGVEFRELQTSARYSEQHLSFILSGAQKAGGTLSLTSEVNLGPAPTTRTNLRAKAWDLGFLKTLVPERSIGGLLGASVQVSGALAKPTVVGTAKLRNGSVSPGAPLYSLRNLELNLNLNERALTLRGTAKSGRGDVTIRGNVAMTELVPSDITLDLDFDGLPVEAGPLTVFIDTETRVRGKAKGANWRFDVDIGDTVVNVPGERSRVLHPDELPSDIVFVDSIHAAPPAIAEAIAKAPVAEIDVYIKAPETIAVRGELVRTVVDIDLHAHLAKSLVLQGTVATRGGWIEVIGRRYDLRRGDIAFGGSADPSLDIQLAHDFAASTLTVAVGGTGSAPALNLRSDPPRYDEAELLSFVLGASPDDDVSEERTAAGRATGVASNYLAGQLQSVVRDVVPIDVLKIDLSDDEAAADKLTVGQWLTDTIFLAYRRRFEAQALENANEAVIEYRFRKRWLIEGTYGDQGTGGADVLWNHRF